MHTIFLTGLLGLLLQSQTPYKPNEEFKIEMEYVIKTRPMANNSSIDLMETDKDRNRRASGGTPLPYLTIHISFLQLSGQELKLRCTDNLGKNRLARKAELNKKYKLDLEYTDDIKDRLTAHEFPILLMSDDRKEISRILLYIDKDGTFLVNGTTRGKF